MCTACRPPRISGWLRLSANNLANLLCIVGGDETLAARFPVTLDVIFRLLLGLPHQQFVNDKSCPERFRDMRCNCNWDSRKLRLGLPYWLPEQVQQV